jgi:hypothetical protein
MDRYKFRLLKGNGDLVNAVVVFLSRVMVTNPTGATTMFYHIA